MWFVEVKEDVITLHVDQISKVLFRRNSLIQRAEIKSLFFNTTARYTRNVFVERRNFKT